MQNPTSHHVTFHVPETGDASRMILSGSMENELMTGSTVIVKKTKDVKENDIIFFITKDGTPVIHRYIATDEAGKFITKGDANPKEDLEKVELDQVQGKVLFH
jgi:signal peptidase